ncbi:hypothetical protein [Streptomyces sp. NPDC059455]|uniref:hypothetical protein n=1 Tax=Streptomyces sp. NPDC059455 TaxID=3346837 RepID=UPI0036832E77
MPTPPADIYALIADDAHIPQRVSRLIDFLAARLPRRLGQAAGEHGMLRRETSRQSWEGDMRLRPRRPS